MFKLGWPRLIFILHVTLRGLKFWTKEALAALGLCLRYCLFATDQNGSLDRFVQLQRILREQTAAILAHE